MKRWDEKIALEKLLKDNNLPITDLNPTEKRAKTKHVIKDGYHLITRTFDLWNLLCANACIEYYNTLDGLKDMFSIESTEISDGYYMTTTKMPHLSVPNADASEKFNISKFVVANILENLNKIDKSTIEKYIGGILSANNVYRWELICLDIGNNNSFVYNNQYYQLDLESFAVICYDDYGNPMKLPKSTNRKPRAISCEEFIDTSTGTVLRKYFGNLLDFLYSF